MARSITPTDASGVTFENVTSSGGFSAGDLVYYDSTGYNKIPTSATPSSGMTTTLTRSIVNYSTPSSGYFAAMPFPGMGFSTSVALLSNGNVVMVYANPNDGYPYFVVFNPSTRATVVGPTVISTTFNMGTANSTNGYNIGVSAFSGGNFLVYWGNNAGGTSARVNYATYTNAGAAVVAVTQDATLAVNNSINGFMKGVTLANGGFVLAFGNGNNVYFRAYDGTGVGQFAWVTLTNFSQNASSTTTPTWGLTARSDNTYLLVGQSTTASTFNYAIYNYAGTAVVATTTFTTVTGAGTSGAIDCCTLSDGTTFVIAYGTPTTGTVSNSGWAFRFLPTGNVLGAASFTSGNFLSTTSIADVNYLRVWALSSGNFLITGASGSTTGACYAIFSSSGTPLLGTKGSIGNASVIRGFGGYAQSQSVVRGVVVTGGNAEVYAGFVSNANTPFNAYSRISLTNYNLVSSTTLSVAGTYSTNNFVTGAYGPAASTPSKAAFSLNAGVFPYSPLTGTSITTTGPYATPTDFASNIACYDMCLLSNGNVFVVTGGTTASQINAYVLNPSTLATITTANIQSITGNTAFSTTSNTATMIKVTPLASGRVCVANASTTSNLRLVIIDSATLTQVGSTVNIVTGTMTSTNASSNKDFDICTISGDRIAVHYTSGTTTTSIQVYSNSLTSLQTFTSQFTDGTGTHDLGIVANPFGFTACASMDTAVGGVRAQSYYELSTNTFTLASYSTANYGNVDAANQRMLTTMNGALFSSTFSGGIRTVHTQFGSTSSLNTATIAGNSVSGTGYGITSTGNVVVIGCAPTTFQISFNTVGGTDTSPTGWIGESRTASGAVFRTAGLYADVMLVGFLVGTNNALRFGTIKANLSSDSLVVQSTDTTNGVPIYPQATTTTTPAIAGRTFAGVAVTDCTAGGTGVIQTTGVTNLNSNYPSTTNQTFDYTGYVAPGVKGTISGRSVSMRKS